MYQIVKFQFPFANNFDKAKPRPSLVVSPSFGKHDQTILAYITTNLEEISDTDLLLDSQKEYFSLTGLGLPSVVKLHRLVTVTPSQIGDVIGELPEEFIPKVKEKIAKVFQLKK